MKNLFVLVAMILMVSCTKKDIQTQSNNSTVSQVYDGKYVLTTKNVSSYDTLSFYYKAGVLHTTRVCSNGGDSLIITVTGQSVVLPKQQTPPTWFIVQGSGTLIDKQLILDYTCDRQDYDPSYHKVYHSVYNKL